MSGQSCSRQDWIKCIRINAKKPHPPQSLHVKQQVRGSFPGFNFCVDCSDIAIVLACTVPVT